MSGASTSSDTLWFAAARNGLVISVLGTTDAITLGDWYGDEDSTMDEFVDGNGETVERGEIDQLVSAMAAFSPSDRTGSGGVEPGAVPNEVQLGRLYT